MLDVLGRGDVSDEDPSPAAAAAVFPAAAEEEDEVDRPDVVGCWMMKRSARREVATAGSSGAMSLERKRRRVWGRVFLVSMFCSNEFLNWEYAWFLDRMVGRMGGVKNLSHRKNMMIVE